jgi:pimeloyl-ACP methyl ester carboxylesterase
VFRLARFPFLLAVIATLAATPILTPPALAADGAANGAAIGHRQDAASSIVIGFVGGFVRHDNPHHGPVLLSKRLRLNAPQGAYVQVFENRHRRTAFETILHLLDKDHDGTLSEAEKAQARIVLFGHSWGGSAVVLLARDLQRVGIPVQLTVQVDSVAKPWQKDSIIPDNVAAAVNFYQTRGVIHGRREIVAADPAKTHILGNYRFDYRKDPVQCEHLSWFDHVTPDHAQSECDLHLWTQVESLVRQRMAPELGVIAVNPAASPRP